MFRDKLYSLGSWKIKQCQVTRRYQFSSSIITKKERISDPSQNRIMLKRQVYRYINLNKNWRTFTIYSMMSCVLGPKKEHSNKMYSHQHLQPPLWKSPHSTKISVTICSLFVSLRSIVIIIWSTLKNWYNSHIGHCGPMQKKMKKIVR